MRPRYVNPTVASSAMVAFESGRSTGATVQGPQAGDTRVLWGSPVMKLPGYQGRPDPERRFYGGFYKQQPVIRPRTFRGFSGFGLGDSEDDYISVDGSNGSSCGCHAGLTGGIEGMIKAHPLATLAGAFLLGYLIKGNKKGLF